VRVVAAFFSGRRAAKCAFRKGHQAAARELPRYSSGTGGFRPQCGCRHLDWPAGLAGLTRLAAAPSGRLFAGWVSGPREYASCRSKGRGKGTRHVKEKNMTGRPRPDRRDGWAYLEEETRFPRCLGRLPLRRAVECT